MNSFKSIQKSYVCQPIVENKISLVNATTTKKYVNLKKEIPLLRIELQG